MDEGPSSLSDWLSDNAGDPGCIFLRVLLEGPGYISCHVQTKTKLFLNLPLIGFKRPELAMDLLIGVKSCRLCLVSGIGIIRSHMRRKKKAYVEWVNPLGCSEISGCCGRF